MGYNVGGGLSLLHGDNGYITHYSLYNHNVKNINKIHEKTHDPVHINK